MFDIQKMHDFIHEYYEICSEFGIMMVKCHCCNQVFPVEMQEEDIENMMEELIGWFMERRDEIAMEN